MGNLDLPEQFTKLPEERNTSARNTIAEGTPPATETQATTTTEQTSAVETPAQAQTTPPDAFFDELNKRFGTQFKAEAEVKDVFGLPQKIAGYESELTKTKDYATKIEQYEKQIEEYKNTGNSEFLSKPLIRKAYIADQLLAKYPDKDPFALQEIVMSDVDKMSDIDVLVKNQKINHPRLSESDIKAVLFKKHGIDSETAPEDWDSIARTEIAMDAESARANIKALTNGIELPKAVTKEERDEQANQALQKRIQATDPIKAEFTAFDRFKKGEIEYDIPSEFKSKLPDMFNAIFLESGMEPTEENKKTAIELRDMTFLYQNLDKILDIAVKKGQVEIQKKLDEALNNTQPPNTATAVDDGTQKEQLPGLSKFLSDNR